MFFHLLKTISFISNHIWLNKTLGLNTYYMCLVILMFFWIRFDHFTQNKLTKFQLKCSECLHRNYVPGGQE